MKIKRTLDDLVRDREAALEAALSVESEEDQLTPDELAHLEAAAQLAREGNGEVLHVMDPKLECIERDQGNLVKRSDPSAIVAKPGEFVDPERAAAWLDAGLAERHPKPKKRTAKKAAKKAATKED